jgi:hypothetical protein
MIMRVKGWNLNVGVRGEILVPPIVELLRKRLPSICSLIKIES